ncbi:ETSous factor-like 3 [Homarus americanus]|uniref:ETSous factor-like 3 n=1 Tax=Homarus americanus TaxID=6706 RepID=A0A8J5JRP7_HOMAM|nr:ETSous factor-like 3 [Homarus americanus]
MDPSFDGIESSLTFNDSQPIDNLCNAYLGNMDSYHSTATQGGASGYLDMYACASDYNDDGQHFPAVDVRDWGGNECVQWAESVCEALGVDKASLDLWSTFSSRTGTHLLQLSQQNFSQLLGPQYGPIFHSQLQTLRKRRGNGNSYDLGGASYSPAAISYDFSTSPYDLESWELTNEDFKDLDRYIPEDGWDPLSHDLQSLELQEEFMPIKYDHQETLPTVALAKASPAVKQENNVFEKIPTNTRRRERGPKSWEFLIRLLEDKRSNPSLIRWEDEVNATFRLVQPALIAQMWGARSEKPNLTYFNFARGLRYHYSTGALLPVSERQLVYKFGPKALKHLSERQQR